MTFAKFIIAFLFALLLASLANAQGTVQGQEQVLTYSGTNISIVPPNTPALNFQVNGTNTFIIPVQPTVSLRIYVTNNTANACNGAFTIQMFAATDNQTNSFNNALANWQTVALQSPSVAGSLVPSVSFNIPASGAVYISSTAISAPKIAVQLVNTTALCSTTNLEVTGVVTSVSVTSPLVSTTTNNPTAGTGFVQGVQPVASNANVVNPIPIAGAQLASNGFFTLGGLDTFNQTAIPIGAGGAFNMTLGSVPALTQGTNVELALGIAMTGAQDIGSSTYNSNWVCVSGISCVSQGTIAMSSAPTTQGLSWVRHFANGGTGGGVSSVLTFRTGTVLASTGIVASPARTVSAGDPLIVVFYCLTGPCSVTNVTDSLSNTFKKVIDTSAFSNGQLNGQGIFIWMNTNNTNAGADTVTVTSTGSGGGSMLIELTGTTASSLVQASTLFQVDPLGTLITHQDAQFPNYFVCNVTMSTNTTTICNAAPTNNINGVAVRAYVTDFQINTTTAGTATTISLVYGTGTNCGTGTTALSAINYPNTTVGAVSIINFRTPLFTSLGQAICVQQAGTTAGTSVVEVHGYLGP